MKFHLIVSLLWSAVVGQQQAGATVIVQRYDIHQISLRKLTRFFRATQRFYLAVKENSWKNMTQKYQSELKEAKGTAKLDTDFHYVHQFEKLIKEFNQDVTVPTWNYTVYHSDPKLDPIFLNYMFGSEVGPEKCLKDGNFKDYKGLDGYCLKRELFSPNTSLPSPKEVDDMLKQPRIELALEHLDKMTQKVWKFLGGMFVRNQPMYDPLHYCIHAFNLKLLKKWSILHKFDLIKRDRRYTVVSDRIYHIST